jgi:hypothetical protein
MMINFYLLVRLGIGDVNIAFTFLLLNLSILNEKISVIPFKTAWWWEKAKDPAQQKNHTGHRRLL